MKEHTVTIEGSLVRMADFLREFEVVAIQTEPYPNFVHCKITFKGDIQKVLDEYNVVFVHSDSIKTWER